MKRYETVIQPARESRQCVGMTCDLCGRQSEGRRAHRWEKGNFDIAETEVRMKVGSSYPEGGNGTEIEIDLCPDCFRNRLVPWLESQGAEINETEWDW